MGRICGLARSAAGRPIVTSGAAPLIVYVFRRVRPITSTGAFQTCDAERAGVHLPLEAGTPDMTIGRADADRVGAHPSCAGGRAGGRNPATLFYLCRARDALALSSKHSIGAPIAASSSAHVKEEETEKHS